MERLGYFAAGFASGWAVRTTVDSSRNLAVRVIAGFYGVVDRASRAAGMEREHLEDLLAEARALYEADRPGGRGPTETKRAAPRTPDSRRDRAA
jgi:hypothetical protein